MKPHPKLDSAFKKVLPTVALITVSAVVMNPFAAVGADRVTVASRFEEIVSLRGQGEYENAISMLRDLIVECHHADDISRQAYNYLVLMIWDESGENAAEGAAQEAMLRFPDISADPTTFPQRLNRLYDDLRQSTYGAQTMGRAPAVAPGAEAVLASPNVAVRFDEAVSLWKEHRYKEAVAGIRGIIDDYHRPEATSGRAYNYLVITVWDAQGREAAVAVATEALNVNPGIEADTIEFPPKLNSLYGEIRSSIFGSLFVEADPDCCLVLLDNKPMGKTPLIMPYVEVGEHDLLLRREGYRDYSKTVEIRPGAEHRIEDIRLSRIRNWWWWTSRVGAPAATLFAIGVLTGGQESKGEEGLPKPPPPPGQ